MTINRFETKYTPFLFQKQAGFHLPKTLVYHAAQKAKKVWK